MGFYIKFSVRIQWVSTIKRSGRKQWVSPPGDYKMIQILKYLVYTFADKCVSFYDLIVI